MNLRTIIIIIINWHPKKWILNIHFKYNNYELYVKHCIILGKIYLKWCLLLNMMDMFIYFYFSALTFFLW